MTAVRNIQLGVPGVAPDVELPPYQALPVLPREVAFDGDTYDPRLDHSKFKGLLLEVYRVMSDGRWRQLNEIQAEANATLGEYRSESSIAARLRDLRKAKYGAFDIQRERRVYGRRSIFFYRMAV